MYNAGWSFQQDYDVIRLKQSVPLVKAHMAVGIAKSILAAYGSIFVGPLLRSVWE